MLLLLAVTEFVTCSVTLLQPWGGDAVERITEMRVKFSVAETRVQGERWGRQQLLQRVNH